jgi:2-methylcitrate dehydratase
LTDRFPGEHSARVRLHLRDGRVLEREQHDYRGFHTRPMDWETVTTKFERLASPHTDADQRARIGDAVRHLEDITVDELTLLL